MVVCAEVRDHAKRSVLRKLYLALGLWFSRKTWCMPVLLSLGGSVLFSGPDVQRGGHLLQYQYGVYRGSGSGLSDRTCHEVSGGYSRFFVTLREMRRVGLFSPIFISSISFPGR